MKQLIILFFILPMAVITSAQQSVDITTKTAQEDGSVDLSPITFTATPDEVIVLGQYDAIPEPFDVKAQTTCTSDVQEPDENPTNSKQFDVATYSELINALKLVQNGDVIQLTNQVAIKPDNTFPNHLGVWEPFVISKAITIDGGALQNKLSFERGLPLELRANVTFKNMNLTMIPEGGINAAFVYVSDVKVIFDNVSTKVEELIAGNPDPRPTIVAGTYGNHVSAGDQAHIIIRNAGYAGNFTAIMAGNHSTIKTSNTIIDIESEDLVVKNGIILSGLSNWQMLGKTIINTSSKRISRYQGFEDGGESILNFKNVRVLPEVTVLNIDKVRLTGTTTQVKFSASTTGISAVSINWGSELTFASKTDNNFSLDVLGGPGTLIIPQNSTLNLTSVTNKPTVRVREWLYNDADILEDVFFDQEQPGDIIYFVNDEKYIRRSSQLEVFTETTQPINELNDASVQYLGEEIIMSGNDKTITRHWRATDNCGNEAFFEQTITVVSGSLDIDDSANLSFSLYPNPVSDVFYFSQFGSIQSVKIVDVNGLLVKEFSQQPAYHIGWLKKGVYIILVESTDEVARFRITKK